MHLIKLLLLISIIGLVNGCTTLKGLPQSQAEMYSGFTYIPIDPFRVNTIANCKSYPVDKEIKSSSEMLDSFPDNSVRISIEQISGSGKATYGTSYTSSKGDQYKVTVDHIISDTTNITFYISKLMQNNLTKEFEPVSLLEQNHNKYVTNSEIYEVIRERDEKPSLNDKKYEQFSLPIYIGVGLRITANVRNLTNNTNISGLGVIGAEAEAKKLQGTLVVQTLGINGKAIASALPIQSELNQTTVQNSIVAIGSIKALLYDNETVKSPRVVGLYLPFKGDTALINAIISELSRESIIWDKPCS
ncbi:hypothetical protein [Acinetobacter junii]|uniref:hypothetical protein n=1 Tax=Acinetobacter junii TaxID=40215 RepID=UPI000F681EAD|nr:hypothetical protein [Acinetobacter junii]RSE33361.1 hypothetical protein EGT62_09050 [Acinetobacter junii]